jgi:hypothetical protein
MASVTEKAVAVPAVAVPAVADQEVRPLVLLCYTWHDPLDDLPDEIALRMDDDAVSVLTLDQQEVLKSFPWPLIGDFEGKLISDDPEEMEMFMFDVKDVGRFAIQCDDFSVLTNRFTLIRDREKAVKEQELEAVNALPDVVRRDSCMVPPVSPEPEMVSRADDKGRLSTIHAIHSQIVICFTWKDPLGELPDEIGLHPLPSSLLIMSTTKQGRSVTTLKIIQWVRILSFSGRKTSENPEDMEEFTFEVEEVGQYTFQCENRSLLERMFAEAKNGSSTAQIQKLLAEVQNPRPARAETARADGVSFCTKPPVVQFCMTKAESFAAHQEAEDEWGRLCLFDFPVVLAPISHT